MTPPRRAAAAAPLLALALAACSPGGGDPEGAPSVNPSATGTPAAPTPRAALGTDLKDGKHYAHLTAYDTKQRTLTVDVVQFLTGSAAQRAAKEDGQEPFEVYVRNQNPRLRTLTVAADVKLTVNTLAADQTGSSAQDVTVTPAELAGYLAVPIGRERVFWFRLKGRVVTEVHEQFLS